MNSSRVKDNIKN